MHWIWLKYLAYKNMSWPTIILVVHKRKQRRHEGEGGLCTLVGGGGGLPSWKILPSWLPVSFDSSTFCWLTQRSLPHIALPKRNFFCGCVLSNWKHSKTKWKPKASTVCSPKQSTSCTSGSVHREDLAFLICKEVYSFFFWFFCSTASNLEFDLVSTAFGYS